MLAVLNMREFGKVHYFGLSFCITSDYFFKFSMKIMVVTNLHEPYSHLYCALGVVITRRKGKTTTL